MSFALHNPDWAKLLPPTFWSSPTDTHDHAEPSTRSAFRTPPSKQAATGSAEHSRLSTPLALDHLEHLSLDGTSTTTAEGMPKKNGRRTNKQNKNKTTTPAAPSSTATAYPRTIHQDDLSSAPLYPSAPLRSTVPLPPVHSHHDEESTHSSVRAFVQEAADDHDDGDFYDAEDSHSSTFTSSASSTFDYTGDESDEDADVSDIEGYGSEEEDLERPFPSPQKAKQEKYARRFAEVDTPSSGSHQSGSGHTSKKGKSAASSSSTAAAAWVDPSLLPPAPSSRAAAPVVSPTTVTAPTSAISQLNKLPSPSAGFDAYYSPPAGSLEHPDDRFPRGRNPHPRLLWRSKLDGEALAVLDAHHNRVVGGPLPRISTVATLSASGVERERDHAGEREAGERGRSRSERRFRAGGRRREWSVEGRRWSRQVEMCGL
ncbi:hypothetical protein JCM8097_005694 [Rhodosporidiobolus ruineniae]